MGKVWVKLGDPNSPFEDKENNIAISGRNNTEVELTDRVQRAISGGILKKISAEDRIVVQPALGSTTDSATNTSTLSFEEERISAEKKGKK